MKNLSQNSLNLSTQVERWGLIEIRDCDRDCKLLVLEANRRNKVLFFIKKKRRKTKRKDVCYYLTPIRVFVYLSRVNV